MSKANNKPDGASNGGDDLGGGGILTAINNSAQRVIEHITAIGSFNLIACIWDSSSEFQLQDLW